MLDRLGSEESLSGEVLLSKHSEFKCAQLASRIHVSTELALSLRHWARSEKLNVLPSLGRDPPPREFC